MVAFLIPILILSIVSGLVYAMFKFNLIPPLLSAGVNNATDIAHDVGNSTVMQSGKGFAFSIQDALNGLIAKYSHIDPSRFWFVLLLIIAGVWLLIARVNWMVKIGAVIILIMALFMLFI